MIVDIGMYSFLIAFVNEITWMGFPVMTEPKFK